MLFSGLFLMDSLDLGVLEDSPVTAIIPAEPVSFSVPDFGRFAIEDRRLVHNGFDALVNYVSLPLITDSFENHGQRREWLAMLSDNQRNYLGRNALRAGSANVVPLSLHVLVSAYSGHAPEILEGLVTDARAVAYHFNCRFYDSLNLDEKIALVGQLKNSVRKVINFVSISS